MDWNWITADGTTLLMIALSGVGIYAALLLFTRLGGLRSFSKMSSFDFAITVAFGSVLASTLLASTPSMVAGIFGLGVLFLIQFGIALLRQRSSAFADLINNEAQLVMARNRVLHDQLAKAQITEKDIRCKLRQAGVTHSHQVFAVIVETTGDVSVIKESDEVEMALFSDVRGIEALQTGDSV